MSVRDLESEVLQLPTEERARLAKALLESLDELSEEENQRLWSEEARRRAVELDEHPERARPASDVFRKARELVG